MGISSALYSGVSGLNTNSSAMTVIGNNLANTNTTGFKGARTVFSDLLSSRVRGSGGVSQVGRGVNLGVVDNIFSQGTFESTESGLDVAIEGESFFMLREDGSDNIFYSRAGAFRFDEDGFLVNPEGYIVQGRQYNLETGELIPGDPGDIQVQNEGLIEAQQTGNIILNTNLDASADPIDPALFDITDPDTYNYSTSTQIFDSLGNAHLMTTYFIKLDPADAVPVGTENQWQYEVSYDTGAGEAVDPAAQGLINFNPDGTIAAPVVQNVVVANWNNGAAQNQAIDITIDTTQFNSDSNVISQNQDGWSAGDLTGIDIDPEGAVVASYSNGEQIYVAHLTLAKFTNPNGLELTGNNLYAASAQSGAARIGLPGAELGKIFTNSLEQSNVDMGKEFVTMIQVQRGFQANSKIITTVDELLGEVINLKR